MATTTTLPMFDPRNENHINRQLSAVVRFGEHLAVTGLDSDAAEGVRMVLKVFRLELERLRTGEQPTAEHLNAVSWARYLTIATIERLLEVNPALHKYDPSRSASSVEEVCMNLLAHSLMVFGNLDSNRHRKEQTHNGTETIQR